MWPTPVPSKSKCRGSVSPAFHPMRGCFLMIRLQVSVAIQEFVSFWSLSRLSNLHFPRFSRINTHFADPVGAPVSLRLTKALLAVDNSMTNLVAHVRYLLSSAGSAQVLNSRGRGNRFHPRPIPDHRSIPVYPSNSRPLPRLHFDRLATRTSLTAGGPSSRPSVVDFRVDSAGAHAESDVAGPHEGNPAAG